jgi:hypothetical protein
VLFGFYFAPLLFLKLPVGKVLVAQQQKPKAKNKIKIKSFDCSKS